jgi:hypothetical protein
MFTLVALLLVVTPMLLATVQDKAATPARRYGIEPDLETFPQKTPQEALGSVIRAIDDRRIDYLLAQLALPEYVDDRVKRVHGGRFEAMVEETTAKLNSDLGVVKKLRRFLNEGTWEVEGANASARLKDVPDRVFLRSIDGRWFFDNSRRAQPVSREK